MIGPATVLFMTYTLTASTASGTCTVNAQCPPDATCTETSVTLEWSKAHPDSINLDGTSLNITRIEEDTLIDFIRAANQTWTLTAPGPALLIAEPGYSGAIRPFGSGNEIEVNIMQIPQRYVDYADAFAARRTYLGSCRGLF